MKKPSDRDPSKPKPLSYSYKKRFYRSRKVAEDYDCHRFTTPRRRARNLRKWRTIVAALERTSGVHSIMDLPCGTGRFTGDLADSGYHVVGSDISYEMMNMAKAKMGNRENICGFVQADAERLPLPNGAVDCVLSIRFMFHVDGATRVRILREMGRVSRRWLIVDYRHRYSLRYARWKLRRILGLTRKPFDRVSRAQLEQEFRDAGLTINAVLPVTRIFSDKWIVIGESSEVVR
jgi:SAM-dependent methyltransferase